MTTVDLEAVRSLLSLLVDRLSETIGDTVDVDGDYYWSLDPATMLNPVEAPDDPTLGSLEDCMEMTRQVLDDPERVVTYNFVWLGDVLRALGVSLHPGALFGD